MAGMPHLCAWGDHETDAPGRHLKSHERQGGYPRQPTWLH